MNLIRKIKKKILPTYNSENNIVVHNSKAIYFPIPKNGSTTLKSILLNNFPDFKSLKINNNSEKYLKYPSPHNVNYPFVKKDNILSDYKNYFRFVIIRNPWDRVVSLYKNKILDDIKINNYPYLPQKIKKNNFDSVILNKLKKRYRLYIRSMYKIEGEYYYLKKAISESKITFLQKLLKEIKYHKGISSIFNKYGNEFYAGMGFNEFVYKLCNIPYAKADPHFKPQYLFFTDRNNNILANYIGKFEEFAKHTSVLLSKLSIKSKIPHRQKGSGVHYSKFYNKKTKNLVFKYYQKDIKISNYSF